MSDSRLSFDDCSHAWEQDQSIACSDCAFHNGPDSGVPHFDIAHGELLLHVDSEDGCGTESFVIWSAADERAGIGETFAMPRESTDLLVDRTPDPEWAFVCRVTGEKISTRVLVTAPTELQAMERLYIMLEEREIAVDYVRIDRRATREVQQSTLGNRSDERVSLPAFRRTGSGGYVPVLA